MPIEIGGIASGIQKIVLKIPRPLNSLLKNNAKANPKGISIAKVRKANKLPLNKELMNDGSLTILRKL
jgi:hypothetical protein